MLPLEINIPASATIFEANHPTSSLTQEDLRAQLNSEKIRDILKNQSIIIINDHHRSTPSGVILEILADLYCDIANVDYIAIAGGTHAEPTDKELSKLTHKVEELFDCELLIHDPHGKDVTLTNIGTTSRGTNVKIHPVILDYNHILCINSVEPHYFAGFTGGIKSIFPGFAAIESVEQNHSWALDSESLPTNIDTNPLQLDLWEVYDLIDKEIYGIQLVNFQDQIFSLKHGSLKHAFHSAVKDSLKIYNTEVRDQFDVIVSVVYPPLDRSLYQAQKGIENTRQALKQGGEMILVAKCHHGIGSNAFYETLKKFETPEEVMKSISREEYKFGDHKAYKFASLAQHSKITIAGELSLTEGRKVFANVITFDYLEFYLNRLNLEGKKIAIVIDSGALTLSFSK